MTIQTLTMQTHLHFIRYPHKRGKIWTYIIYSCPKEEEYCSQMKQTDSSQGLQHIQRMRGGNRVEQYPAEREGNIIRHDILCLRNTPHRKVLCDLASILWWLNENCHVWNEKVVCEVFNCVLCTGVERRRKRGLMRSFQNEYMLFIHTVLLLVC